MTGRSRRRFVRYIWHRNVTDRVSYFQIRSRSYFIYTSWRIAVRGRTTIDDHPFSLSLFFTLLSKTKRWKISNSFRTNIRQVEMVRSNRRKRGYAKEGRKEGTKWRRKAIVEWRCWSLGGSRIGPDRGTGSQQREQKTYRPFEYQIWCRGIALSRIALSIIVFKWRSHKACCFNEG